LFFETFDPSPNAFLSIRLFPGPDNVLHRDIGTDSVKFDILHKFLVFHIIRLKEGVLVAIKFKRRDVMSLAEFPVEGRRGFHPFPPQMELDKTVVDKEVASEKFDELPGREMIPDRCKTHTRWDAAHSSQSTEERGFWDTEASASLQDITGTVMFGSIKRRIGIIANIVPHGPVEFDHPFHGIFAFPDGAPGIGLNVRVVAVNNSSGI
jgi:hypothetical protein